MAHCRRSGKQQEPHEVSKKKKRGAEQVEPRNSIGLLKNKPCSPTTADLSVMADIGTALQMCAMRSNTSPIPLLALASNTTHAEHTGTASSKHNRCEYLAGAFERVTSENRRTSMQ